MTGEGRMAGGGPLDGRGHMTGEGPLDGRGHMTGGPDERERMTRGGHTTGAGRLTGMGSLWRRVSPKGSSRGGRGSFLLALLIVLSTGVAALFTMSDADRASRIYLDKRWAVPDWTCPSGYDGDGRCVLSDLMGGVHGFLEPGVLAACITLVLGASLGLALAHERTPLRGGLEGVVGALEALPRLAVLLVVFLVSGSSLTAMGMALGLLCAPGLAAQIRRTVADLQQKSFVEAARGHGVSERRVQLYHLLWLSCRGQLVRYAAISVGYMLIAESSFAYALQLNSSTLGRSWGDQLRVATESLYAAILRSFILAGHGSSGGARAWLELSHFCIVAGSLLAVLWAIFTLGERIALSMESTAWR